MKLPNKEELEKWAREKFGGATEAGFFALLGAQYIIDLIDGQLNEGDRWMILRKAVPGKPVNYELEKELTLEASKNPEYTIGMLQGREDMKRELLGDGLKECREELLRLRTEINVLKRLLGWYEDTRLNSDDQTYTPLIALYVKYNLATATNLSPEESEILKQKEYPPQKTELECLLNEVFE